MKLAEKTVKVVEVEMAKNRMDEVLDDLVEHGYTFNPLLLAQPITMIDCAVYFRGEGDPITLVVSSKLSCFCPCFINGKSHEKD